MVYGFDIQIKFPPLLATAFRTDAKTVAIIALGCFHPVTKVQSASAHFFLGGDEEDGPDSDEEEVCCYVMSSASFGLPFC